MEKKVLFVEDDQAQRYIMSRILQSRGIEAVLAMDGLSALEIFNEDPGRYGVVLTDLMMPRMDGLELCRELKALSEVPVFLCSGSVEEVKEREDEFRLFDMVFSKPLDFERLSESISRYCGSR